MTDNPRVELAARALARYRLGQHSLASGLHSDTARRVLDQAAEKLWPSLLDEAEAIVEALDGTPSATEPARGEAAGPQALTELEGEAEEAASQDLEHREREGEDERKQAERLIPANNRPHKASEPEDAFVNPLGRSSL